MADENALTVREIVGLWRTSQRAIKDLIASGALAAHKVSGIWMVKLSDLGAFLKAQDIHHDPVSVTLTLNGDKARLAWVALEVVAEFVTSAIAEAPEERAPYLKALAMARALQQDLRQAFPQIETP